MFKNTKKQGDWGLGIAIAYFTSKGYTVLLPLTDSQDYDLVIDDNSLQRIQVKTTTFKRRSNYVVSLTIKGGNKSCTTIKKFNKTLVDYVFIVTGSNDKYLIPSEKITNQITLNKKWSEFKI